MKRIFYGIGTVALLAGLAGGYHWWRTSTSPAPAAPAAAVATPRPPAAPPSAPTPAVRYPIDPPAAASAAPGDATARAGDPAARFQAALEGVLGRTALLQWVQVDDFARRLVATVDNLARPHAPALLWPVNPTPGRFSPVDGPEGEVIGTGNHARYAAFLGLVERLDSRRLVALYRAHYPWFQSAYEELGYPGLHFNDRLVDVIDHLLATPEPPEPLRVQLVEVKGSVPSLRPWVRYEFAEPALEARSAGQKLLLRMGLEHQRRVKTKLTELRQGLVQRSAAGG